MFCYEIIWSVPALTSQFLVLRFGGNFEFTSGKCVFFSPNNIIIFIFFERFLLYSILFISFRQIHDFFLSLHKVFKHLNI